MSAPFVVRSARAASAIAPCGAEDVVRDARAMPLPSRRARREARRRRARRRERRARAGVEVRKNIRREETATRGWTRRPRRERRARDARANPWRTEGLDSPKRARARERLKTR